MNRKPKKTAGTRNSGSADPHIRAARQYVDHVLSEDVPACKWVREACERHHRDLKRQRTPRFPYEFLDQGNPAPAAKVCRFIESLPHVKGPLAGQLIRLEAWQCFILTSVFGWVHDRGLRIGKRRFRRVYIEIPRGNSKSTLSSGVGLFCLTSDKEGGADIFSVATTRDQARIVFQDAQQMARKSKELMKQVGVEVLAHNINVLRTGSKFEALSAEGQTLDGLNIHLAIVDELHAHKTRSVYDVIETATAKRNNSLLWCITTAGSDRAGICYEVRTYVTKILDRVVPDEHVFGVIYTLDDGDDWQSEKSWIKANPNWGVSVQPDVVAQLAAKAVQMPAAQSNFKTKHLDVWVNANMAWMDMRAWDRCADPALRIEAFEGEPCMIGLDLATKTDIAAKVRVFWKDLDDGRHYYLFPQFYLPQSALSDGRNSQYPGWETEELLTVTPGDVLDFETVREDLIEDSRRFQVEEIAYDPWQAAQLAQQLQADGATVIEYRNTVAMFSAPMKEIDALVRSGRLHHDGNRIMTWMISNVVCHIDAKENIYPRKERPENKIDGVIGLIMGLGRALVHQPSQGSYACTVI